MSLIISSATLLLWIILAWWCTPVVADTWDAEVRGPLEPMSQKSAWTT